MQYKFDLSMFVEERRKKVEQQKKKLRLNVLIIIKHLLIALFPYLLL